MNDRSVIASEGARVVVHARPGRDADAVDGIVPQRVVRPRDAAETAAVVADARAERRGLIVRGSGSLLGTGNRPRALDTVLETAAMDRIVEHNHEDLTVTVQAGVTLRQLSEALESRGQRLAVDAEDSVTVGGVVAANAAGGLAYGFGAPRDLVLGMTVIDGAARTLKLGGRVVKNVAGYDLVRVFSGSFGTLGIITELTLRTHPMPAAATTFEASFADSAQLEKVRAALFHSELPLAAFDLEKSRASAPSAWRLVLRLEGTSGEIAYQRERCGKLCAAGAVATADVWRSPIGARTDENVIVRCGTLPDRTVALAERIAAEAQLAHRIAARLGDGTLRVFARAQADEAAIAFVEGVRSIARGYGSHAVIERAPAGVKLAVDAWGEPPAGFALMRELKKRFDPDAVLAPGRFIGGL